MGTEYRWGFGKDLGHLGVVMGLQGLGSSAVSFF